MNSSDASSSAQSQSAATIPANLSINVDIESLDAVSAGGAGLFGKYAYGRYGLREGIPRLLAVLQEHAVAATFFIDAFDASRHPALIEALTTNGHEIALRSDVWAPAHPTEGREDLDALAAAVEVLKRVTGTAPKGWRSANGIVTPGTLPRLSQLGFDYDSSFFDDDQPYLVPAEDGAARSALVELPMFDYLSDITFYGGRHSPARVAQVWAEETEAMCAEGGYLHLVLHSRGDTGTARAVRVEVLAKWLADTLARPGVRFYRCCDLALAWRSGQTSHHQS